MLNSLMDDFHYVSSSSIPSQHLVHSTRQNNDQNHSWSTKLPLPTTDRPFSITVLQSIGVGLILSIANMAISALVEAKRLRAAREHKLIVDNPRAVVPMRVWWLLPQYMICEVSDALSAVGLEDLFYSQMPESLRSLGGAP